MPTHAYRFAHFTDIHLPIREKPATNTLLNKRALGYLSWRRKRAERHQQWASEALVNDAKSQSCNLALITGDIVNIALPAEFQDARNWLDAQFGDMHVVYTPSNHDTYTHAKWDNTLGMLAPYMQGTRTDGEPSRAPTDFSDFPFCVQPENAPNFTVIAANSSPTTAPGLATGALGADQRAKLKTMINAQCRENSLNILMLHHPITPGVVSKRKELTDRTHLCADLADSHIDLVLHGHAHIQHFDSIKTAREKTTVIGGASASHPFGHGKYRPARYNLFDVEPNKGGGWSIKMTIRELDPHTKDIFSVETHKLV